MDAKTLVKRLRFKQLPGAESEGTVLMAEAADLIERQAAEIEALRAELQRDVIAERNALLAENAKLKTVMIAAAEEIQAHWDAHCDAEGYGPANLMRRLEEGIPSEYGYTAGAFAELRAEVEALRAALKPFADADLTLPTVRDTFGFDVLRARAALAQPAEPAATAKESLPVAPAAPTLTDGLLDRIERALERHVYGHAALRIPADQTDSDIVLYELRTARSTTCTKT